MKKEPGEEEPHVKKEPEEDDLNSEAEGLNVIHIDFGVVMPKGTEFFDEAKYLEHGITKCVGPDPSKLYFGCELCNVTASDPICFQKKNGA